MLSFHLKIRIFWLILLFLIIIFFVFRFISPSGSWRCHQNFKENGFLFSSLSLSASSCISPASPSERVVYAANGPLLVLADPVYFSIFSPRPFSRAEVEITYRPHLSSSTPVFEAGFLADAKLWRYQLKPVYNLWLEQGFSSWSSVQEGSLRLLQRNKRFTSVSEFLDAWRQQASDLCVHKNCLAVYNLTLNDFPPPLDFSALKQDSGLFKFPYALRGAHQFYFYLPQTGLDLSGSFFDLNDNKDKDEAQFLIFSGQRQVASVSLIDQRPQVEESSDRSPVQNFSIARSDLGPGLYRLEFKANNDLVFNSLRINSSYLSVINKIWPFDQEKIFLFTDAPYLQVKSLDPGALQEFSFGQERVSLSEIYHQYEFKSRQGGLQSISLERGGLILENNGVFAATADSLLNPDYQRLDRFSNLSEDIDFVLADYQPARAEEDAWLHSRLDFESSTFYRENQRYSFILSIPGLKLEGGAGGLLEIKEIRVRFYGKSLREKISDWLH